jgi:serine/threonine protein kinase HipA of HipAB toxin-antitoxin module
MRSTSARAIGGQTEIAVATEATGDTRIMFNVLIQNTDDHLRNLGFLARDAGKWGLSPPIPFRRNARP